jgi:anthranilate synthase component 2
MKILLVDNYDSFTYNLLHYLEGESGTEVEVVRNDQLSGLDTSSHTHIVISPGPGLPSEAADLIHFIKQNQQKKMLGVCLGQQAIAEAFGLNLSQLKEVVHGQARSMKLVKPSSIFAGLPSSFKVGRYHSWVVENSDDLKDFEILAVDEQENLMAIEHKKLPLTAVQFHPESILTEYGREMIRNWLDASEPKYNSL